MSAPRDPAFFDWESPEVGDAIRRILDALEQPAGPVGKARLRALYDLGSAGRKG